MLQTSSIPARSRGRAIQVAAIFCGICVLLVSLVVLSQLNLTALRASAVANFRALEDFLSNHFISRWFPVFFAFVFFLEWLKPAQARGGIRSRGFAYDVSIGIILITFQYMIVGISTAVLFAVYARIHAPIMSGAIIWLRAKLEVMLHTRHHGQRFGLPTNTALNWILATFGLMVGDFLSWGSHLIRHKVPRLWRFHAMHHSQEELNIFTEFRSHPLDSFFAAVLQSIPLYLLQVPFSVAVQFLVFYKYYLMFTHANVDIDYGWLNRIFVSPKFHRVHHAAEVELYDHNYGAVLSLWDTIFRTAKVDVPHSPRTGVDDFPTEYGTPMRQTLPLYFRQLAAPFRPLPPSSGRSETPPTV